MKRRKRSYYDPAPRRRKGKMPAGLKRYWATHRRTHDPAPRRVKHHYRSPTHIRRYDPSRFARLRHYGSRARHYGSKAESMLNKWAAPAGFFGTLGFGIYDSYSKIDKWFKDNGYGPTKPDPVGNKTAWERYVYLLKSEYQNLYKNEGVWTTQAYLKYKFLGTDPSGAQTGSSWSNPFILSLAAFVATTIAKMTGKLGKYSRIINPINKLAKGALAASVIGALVLPGTGQIDPGRPLPNPNVVNMVKTPNGSYAQTPQTNQYQKIEGAF